MSKRLSELENLFDSYNRSLQVVCPGEADTFVCPLCMKPFRREDISNGNLSLEHVPPRSIKTAIKTVTCTRCNNTVGSKLQRFMSNDARRKELEAGKELDRPIRAKIEMGGIKFDTDIAYIAGHEWRSVSLISNLPPRLKNLEAVKKVVGTEAIISLKGLGNKEALDRAYLHSSYLWLFSMLGYPYIMQPFMEGIRRKITDGQELSIASRVVFPKRLKPRLPFLDPRDKNVEVTLIGTAADPEESCLALIISGELVLMPFVSDHCQKVASRFEAMIADRETDAERNVPFHIHLMEIDPSCKYSIRYVFEKGRRVGDFDTLRLSPVRGDGWN